MKQSINFYEFEQAFRNHNRYDSFGYDGLKVIFESLEQYEDDCDTEIELDVIAICCEYNMLTFDEVISEYGLNYVEEIDNCTEEEFVIEYLNENTWVLGTTNDSVIFQVF